MYKKPWDNQLSMEEFFLPFGGRLSRNNRWVKLAQIIPWDHIEEEYMAQLNLEEGRPALSSRIAFGAIFIKEYMNFTDAETALAISENPGMQYFLGQHAYRDEPLFDSSMMVHFRKRFSVNTLAKVNECICMGRWPEEIRNVDRNKENDEEHDDLQPPSDEADSQDGGGTHKRRQKGQKNRNTSKKKEKKRKKKNHGKLILDATVAPADIKYPTDLDLLNKSREHLEHAIDLLWPYVPHTSHKLPYSSKIARKSYLNLAKSKKWTKAKCRKAVGEQLHYVALAMERLEKMKELVPDWPVCFPYWLHARLKVIPLVYTQQKEMYENNSHKCENRICSLEQPHVRPIKRGKRPIPTEFGQKLHLSIVDGYAYLEQTSWENFNEGTDLQAAVHEFYRRFGHYPAAILADKIYQTMANRTFCKELGIRLSGPPLGRPKAGETDAVRNRQMYRDACERNVVESRNGNAKRRFGLDRIMAKLDETAKTEAILNIIAMNAARRVARWLALFFRFWTPRLA